ncbi:chromodomain-helicase-DNA-binding multidomain chromatin with the following architecture [Cryptosporidium sp. chipmunk genotype I]|uniref:chromodomain-helicase-DNA-binding multidomain chromatin with the following architecture n=1 Tax=Cryptosporidium sp. chipmunk genotype I TaxID=1280935 RepID=UPI00351A337E|nr:chromodomain-helicase-DNA-binding multidomain chromatin with the following architecture [Cryptosporidium sp. chipmunk genotype I]
MIPSEGTHHHSINTETLQNGDKSQADLAMKSFPTNSNINSEATSTLGERLGDSNTRESLNKKLRVEDQVGASLGNEVASNCTNLAQTYNSQCTSAMEVSAPGATEFINQQNKVTEDTSSSLAASSNSGVGSAPSQEAPPEPPKKRGRGRPRINREALAAAAAAAAANNAASGTIQNNNIIQREPSTRRKGAGLGSLIAAEVSSRRSFADDDDEDDDEDFEDGDLRAEGDNTDNDDGEELPQRFVLTPIVEKFLKRRPQMKHKEKEGGDQDKARDAHSTGNAVVVGGTEERDSASPSAKKRLLHTNTSQRRIPRGKIPYEYLVKYHHQSYSQCKWISEDDIDNDPDPKVRIKYLRYIQRLEQRGVEGIDATAYIEDVPELQYIDGDIERIVDCTDVFRSLYPMKAAEIGRNEWYIYCLKIIDALVCFDRKGVKYGIPFLRPVDPNMDGASDYYSVISRPMDFTTVQTKLYLRIYSQPQEFWSDVQQIFTNCFHYNSVDSDIYVQGKLLKALFDKLYGEWALLSRQTQEDLVKQKSEESPKEWLDDQTVTIETAIQHVTFRDLLALPKRPIMYFAKWKHLSFADNTWEHEVDITDSSKILQFHRFVRVPEYITTAHNGPAAIAYDLYKRMISETYTYIRHTFSWMNNQFGMKLVAPQAPAYITPNSGGNNQDSDDSDDDNHVPYATKKKSKNRYSIRTYVPTTFSNLPQLTSAISIYGHHHNNHQLSQHNRNNYGQRQQNYGGHQNLQRQFPNQNLGNSSSSSSNMAQINKMIDSSLLDEIKVGSDGTMNKNAIAATQKLLQMITANNSNAASALSMAMNNPAIAGLVGKLLQNINQNNSQNQAKSEPESSYVSSTSASGCTSSAQVLPSNSSVPINDQLSAPSNNASNTCKISNNNNNNNSSSTNSGIASESSAGFNGGNIIVAPNQEVEATGQHMASVNHNTESNVPMQTFSSNNRSHEQWGSSNISNNNNNLINNEISANLCKNSNHGFTESDSQIKMNNFDYKISIDQLGNNAANSNNSQSNNANYVSNVIGRNHTHQNSMAPDCVEDNINRGEAYILRDDSLVGNREVESSSVGVNGEGILNFGRSGAIDQGKGMIIDQKENYNMVSSTMTDHHDVNGCDSMAKTINDTDLFFNVNADNPDTIKCLPSADDSNIPLCDGEVKLSDDSLELMVSKNIKIPSSMELYDKLELEEFCGVVALRSDFQSEENEEILSYRVLDNVQDFCDGMVYKEDIESTTKVDDTNAFIRAKTEGVSVVGDAFSKIDQVQVKMDESEKNLNSMAKLKDEANSENVVAENTNNPMGLASLLANNKIADLYCNQKRPPPPPPGVSRHYPVSPIFKNGYQLFDYQLAGLNWLLQLWSEGRNGILADEMGLGKTMQTMSFVWHLVYKEKLRGPFLVVAPLSTLDHWKRTFEDWTDLNVVSYYDEGGRNGRDLLRHYEFYHQCLQFDMRGRGRSSSYNSFGGSMRHYGYVNEPRLVQTQHYKFHVLLTSYEILLADADILCTMPWQFVIIDEAHRLKNRGAKTLQVFKSIACRHILLLSGTPVQNNTEELWPLLNYIEPIKFASIEAFTQEFGELQTSSQVSALHELLRPHLLRRVKEDVMKEIPPLEETIIDVELTTAQKAYYRAIFERNRAFLCKNVGLGGKKSGSNAPIPSLMNVEVELRKCCNHPFQVVGVEEREVALCKTSEERYRKMIELSGKMVLMGKLLPKLKAEGHRVLIFSQFIQTLTLLEELVEHHGWGYERLDGSIRGTDRTAAIARFNAEDSDKFVFLLSTRAGGLGINLTSADTVIIFDSDWNPQNDVQACARAHRIGQTRDVKVYRLITARTYEAEMFERASRKLGLNTAVFHKGAFREENNSSAGNGIGTSGEPTKQEIEDLLKHGAYYLLEGSEASRQFQESDIDEILSKNSRLVRYQLSGKNSSFSKTSFRSDNALPDLDVNDPDFWKKVLGDSSVSSFLVQLQSGSAIRDDESREKFIQDLADAVDGAAALDSLDPLIEALVQVTNMREFSELQRQKAEDLLANVQDIVKTLQPNNDNVDENDEEDSLETDGRSKSRKKSRRATRAKEFTIDNYVLDEYIDGEMGDSVGGSNSHVDGRGKKSKGKKGGGRKNNASASGKFSNYDVSDEDDDDLNDESFEPVKSTKSRERKGAGRGGRVNASKTSTNNKVMGGNNSGGEQDANYSLVEVSADGAAAQLNGVRQSKKRKSTNSNNSNTGDDVQEEKEQTSNNSPANNTVAKRRNRRDSAAAMLALLTAEIAKDEDDVDEDEL